MRLRFFAAYLQRFVQVSGILLPRLCLALWRWLRKRPTNGAQMLREGLELIGGTFVKFGQVLSLQMDTLPREYCDALLGLLDRVPTCSREEVDHCVRAELGAPPTEVFAEFDYEAIGSASIGQVHQAVLKDGTKVAVKVQRPNVREEFRRDLLLLKSFAGLVFLFGIRTLYFTRDLIRELDAWTEDELDYRREAAQCDMLAHNSAGSATERVPRVFWELTTSRLLTMEYLEGPSVSKYLRMLDANDTEGIEALKAAGFDEDVFCGNIITNFLQDAFHHGVFHADLHPANLLILPNNVVGYVDFGIVAKLTPEARRKQIELTLAYASGVADDIYREFLNICTMTEDTDLEGMRRCIGEMARTWYAQPIVKGRVRFKVSITKGMMDLLDASRAYGTLVDREMIKYIRSSVLVDGLVMRLAPGFDIAGALRECVESYLVEEAKRKTLSPGGALTMLTDLAVWLQGGPSAMIRALDLFERRQVVFRASISTPRKRQDAGRLRMQATATGLIVSIIFLTASGGWRSLSATPFFAYTAGIFVTSWSLWLLVSLRRQPIRRR